MHNESIVLIVDDEEFGRETIGDLLAPSGYQLLFAENGYEALDLAIATPPDLILLDVMMPGLNGFTVCQRLRADERTMAVPILMITALDDRASRLKGIESGADDFLCKPFDRLELQIRVRNITRINRYRLLMEERQRAEEQARRTAQEIAKAYDMTLQGWAWALDLRDNETEGHSRRVTELTVRLARKMGISEGDIAHIQRGALLHDIGKLGIPDSILLKPGPLTDEEWVIMRQHPVYAYEWLSAIEFLHPALDIPYSHHEKWDGTGYPQGLKGDAIPLAARIFAVVDVWDAMTSDRPYRAALPADTVREHIRAQAGTHFAPPVVDAFLQLQPHPIAANLTG